MTGAVANLAAALPWREASQSRLEAALEDLLVRIGGTGAGETPAPPAFPQANALDQLAVKFDLSAFERDLLVLAAGCELDGRFLELLARADGETAPSFAGAAEMLEDAHWSAVAPDGPLRRGRLLRLDLDGDGLARRRIRIEEAVLHELLGLPHLDDSLRTYLDPLPSAAAERLLPSQLPAVERLAGLWTAATAGPRPVAWLGGVVERPAARALVAAAGRRLGWGTFVLDAGRLPDDPPALEALLERWRRDAVLQAFLLLVELDDEAPWPARVALRHWLERCDGPTALLTDAPPGGLERPLVRLDLPSPAVDEARRLWHQALGPVAARLDAAEDPCLDHVARQFPLSPRAIREVALEVRGASGEPGRELWRRARRRARGGLDRLAQRLEPMVGWDDLVLPPAQSEALRSIAAQVRQRTRVYDTWGFAAKSSRGLGLGALFSGPSGTGKTMAAEVLAADLDLDLYRIDLPSVVSKYIGETERNLRRLFDAAERSGAILLFDEADSLFGKRSEVRDSHDRYANLEVSYLLQRIESYRGLAILTSNFDKSLDAAFLRRLRFVVPFPFPGTAERRRIWRQVFPQPTPTDGLDFGLVARLAVTGGSIRNIALGAAFRAADEDRAVTMADLQAAARVELAKIGQPVPENELRGWKS